ncbi:vacuolar protein sorting-associated protein [Chloropicon primus]|uniref:Vacuolar protein sorting-associated protein n=4 Tax=Chloropicon primus TaxID=1764295 RepID=A0A5B8MQK3_9CHLO|nr:vacuolar protein sorting-associated protein [Chloropicon primus]|eukprot:QDZ21895.1 vacuolar protein sorting-associated protein [Chloropicon primus]
MAGLLVALVLAGLLWAGFWPVVVRVLLHAVLALIASPTAVGVEITKSSLLWPKSVKIKDLRLRSFVLAHVDAFVHVKSLRIDCIEVRVPNLSASVGGIRIDGTRVHVTQRRYPKPRKRAAVSDETFRVPFTTALPRSKVLEVVEKILWGGAALPGPDAASAANTAGGKANKGLPPVLGRVLERLSVRVSRTTVHYSQAGQTNEIMVSVGDLYLEGSKCLTAKRYELLERGHGRAPTCVAGLSSLKIGVYDRSHLVDDQLNNKNVVYLIQQWSVDAAVTLGCGPVASKVKIALDVNSLAITLDEDCLNRMLPLLSNLQYYFAHESVWKYRPQEQVFNNARRWWHYAVNAVREECTQYRCPSVSLSQLGERREKRERYLSVYKGMHGKWWEVYNNRKKVGALLRETEKDLTLEEIAHFRSHFAFSRVRPKDRTKFLERLGAVDGIVNNFLLANAYKDVERPSLEIILDIKCPKVSVSISQASYWDSYQSTTSVALLGLEVALYGQELTVNCAGLKVSNNNIQEPLVRGPEKENLLNLTTEADINKNPYFLVLVSNVDVALCPDWMEQLMDVANLLSSSAKFFAKANANIKALVMDTYRVHRARPAPLALGAPIVLKVNRLAASLLGTDAPPGEPDYRVTLSIVDVTLEKRSSMKHTADLRSQSLHRRRRQVFQTIAPCSVSKMKVAADLCIFIEKSVDGEIEKVHKVLDLKSFLINMDSEECAVPKSIAAPVARCGVTLPILKVFVSESRLRVVSQTLDQMLLRIAVKKECKIRAPEENWVALQSGMSAVGFSDAFADYYINTDTIAVNFLTDPPAGDSRSILALGLCNIAARYYKDSIKDLQVLKFGIGLIKTEAYSDAQNHCILGPRHNSCTVDLARRFSSRRGWGRVRQKLQSEMILDYFPSWMTSQVQGTVYISGSNTTATMVHLANVDILVDTSLCEPIIKYVFELQESFSITKRDTDTPKDDLTTPLPEESSEVDKSMTLMEINVTSISVTLSHSLQDIACLECLNTTASVYKSVDSLSEDENNTKLNIESMHVLDLIGKSDTKECLGIHPLGTEEGYGLCLTHDVKGDTGVTVIRISKVQAQLIMRFIQDILFFVSRITGALPSKEETDGETNDEEKSLSDNGEDADSKGASSLHLSVENIEVILPIHSDNPDKFFKLVANLKVQSSNEIQCPAEGLKGRPHLEICLNNLALGFQHTYLGFQNFIPETSLLCYIESIEGTQTRVVLFWNVLCVKLSQLNYGHLMEFLSGNMGDRSVFAIVEEEEIVVRSKEDFMDSAYRYQEFLKLPKEESPSFEVCIRSSKWEICFEDTDSPTQYGVFKLDSPSFVYRGMSSGNTHMCISGSNFSLTDMHTRHNIKEIMNGSLQVKPSNEPTEETCTPSFKFVLLMQKEGPMTVELRLCNTLISWPYEKDMAFISNILSVLKTNETNDSHAPVKLVSPSFAKWFYFNLIATDTRIFVPLPLVADAVQEQSNGVLVKTNTLQFRYGFGSDGETAMRVRVFDLEVAFKLKSSQPNDSFLLPFNLDVEMNTSAPVFEEQVARIKKVLVARKLQRWWRENHSESSLGGSSPPPGDLGRAKSFTQLTKRKAFTLEHGITPNERETALTKIRVSLDNLVLKACFSEVHLWNRILKTVSGTQQKHDVDESASEGVPEPLQEVVFRPSTMEVDLKINSVSVVICDDRPRTYGNPDVLRLWAKTLQLQYKVVLQEEDVGAKTSADLKVTLSAEYLDSSVSRYASIILDWPVQFEFHQQEDAYSGKSNSLWLNSEERLDIHVSPHILLALGDAMTFSRMLNAETSKEYTQNMRKSTFGQDDVEEGELDSGAAPQKYCLNNYSGANLWYWSTAQTAHRVMDGKRVIVKEKPYLAEKQHSKGKRFSRTSAIQVECLNLQFEGNWSPLLQVNVSLVGKYKYTLEAPLHNIEVPVIVDIILVGRTKVISVHSPYWIFNRSDRELAFRLQQSLGYLNAPGTQEAGEMEADTTDVRSDVMIGPIEPGKGVYLPITSSIMSKSVLFVNSADGLLEATAHSIHITEVDKMDVQQQMIECKAEAGPPEYTPTPQLKAPGQTSSTPGSSQSKLEEVPMSDMSIPETNETSPVEVSMEDIQLGSEEIEERPPSRGTHSPTSVLSENNAGSPASFFCNLQIMKVPPQQVHLPSYNIDSQGLSSAPLPVECELSFQPPLVIANALPYDIEIDLMDAQGRFLGTRRSDVVDTLSTLDRTSSIGSAGSRTYSITNSASRRRLQGNMSPAGIILKPGSKADIYCDLQQKQKLSIRVKTAAQGMLKTQAPIAIHDGYLVNDKTRQGYLPKHATLYPFMQSTIGPNASELTEIELTSANLYSVDLGETLGLDLGETPVTGTPGPSGPSDLRVLNKQKVKIGIENEPTGRIGRKVTIYCPYWIDNQTNSDLFFSENNSLPLFGKARRRDEIFVPGNAERAPTLPLPVLWNTDNQRIYFRMAGEKPSPYGPSVHIKRPGPSGHNPIPIAAASLGGHNQYGEGNSDELLHFGIDILPCPADSIYNKTKVICVKTAIIVENMSNFSIIYKQSGMTESGHHCRVEAGQSVGHKWSSIYNPLEITIRPSGNIWNWSSSFPLLATGDTYFGLRLSHQDQDGVFLIIPVSITVSPSHILVSFKDPSAEPPYRIQNDCKEILIVFKQVEDKKSLEGKADDEERLSLQESNPQTTVMPGTSINYAWDVPMWPHKLSVELMRENDMATGRTTEYSIDELGDRKPIAVSESKHGRSTSRAFIPTPSFSKKQREKNAATQLEKKLKSVLAKELASKVFVTVYADGPTRVLKFSDKKDSASIQSELSMLEMHARLRKLEDELANNVNRKFASLMGYMKSRPLKIDLYGRNQKHLDSYLKLSTSVIETWKAQKTPGRRKLEAKHQAKTKGSMSSNSRRRIAQEILLNEMNDSLDGDSSAAILSLGGELTVTIHSANNLAGNPQSTHTYAEVDLNGQSYQTNICLQTCSPTWDEAFTFPSARATNFLDLNIYRVKAQRCAPVRKSGAAKLFLGSVRISLLESFTMESNDSIHYTLGRQHGTDKVSGEVVISLSWRTNANSLMQLKVQTLEDILAQRMEILAQLKPLSVEQWEERVSNVKKRETLLHQLGYQTGELQVTVMAARNLQKRTSFQPLATLDFSIEGPLCNPFVLVKCSKSKTEGDLSTDVVHQSLEPLFDKSKKFVFEEVPLSASVTFELYDKNPLGRSDLLAWRTVYCSEISTSVATPFNPVYAWIRLTMPKRVGHGHESGPSPEINVRMQWNPPHSAIRNVTSINVTLSSIGLAMISGVLGGELINTTLEKIKVSKVQDDKETTIVGSIQKIQIDNQLPHSTQPVILRCLSSMGNQADFLRVSFSEIFTSKGGEANIRSIKDFQLDFGDLKLEVDDLFMDSVLKFSQAFPIRDLYQDEDWNTRQDCMLNFTLPFGPPEIEDLSGTRVEDNSIMEGFAHPTDWYRNKAAADLTAMRALSSSSSWYFIENAEIGSLRVTLSLSIASQVLAGPDGGKKSLLSRSLNTSGLQLLDVDDAPLQISGLSFSDEVIGKNALNQRIRQHLQWQIIGEAHKILGGTGPAIIAAPLSVVYACSSAFTIGQEISAGRVGPLMATQQLGYVIFSAASQAIGALSKTAILLLAVVPTDEDHGDWADSQTLKRYSGKAINAPRSIYVGLRELFTGTVRGISGVLTDPVWAYQRGGLVLLPLGVMKGLLGVAVRPTAGFLEGASRLSQGLGLLCLGKEGIEGNIPHRVRAPEVMQATQLESITSNSEEKKSLDKWTETLSKLTPLFDKDALIHYLELDQASSKRRYTMLFTKGHKIILVGSKELKETTKYFICWTLLGTSVKQVLGREDKFKIKMRHITRFPTACCGVWEFPNTKVIQCATKDIFTKAMSFINIQRGSEATKAVSEELRIERNDANLELVPRSYYI